MKTILYKCSKKTIFILLCAIMFLTCLVAGTISTHAGSWISFKRLYFGVPISWGTPTNVYAAARQSNGYCVIIGKLTEKVSNSRIYGTETGQNIDHSTWGTEHLFIFSSTSSYSVGSEYGSVSAAKKTATGSINITSLNSTDNNYFIYPKSDADGCEIESRWNNYGDMGYLGTDGTIAQNQGNSPYAQQKVTCSANGTATISGYRIKENTTATFEGHSASVSADDNKTLGCIVGSQVTVTATANTNYKLDGFYSDSSYATKITDGVDGNTLTYTVTSSSEKNIYVKYVYDEPSYTVTLKQKLGSNTATNNGTLQAYASSTTTLAADQYVTKDGVEYKFVNWTTSSSAVTIGSTTSYSTTIKTTAAATVTANYEECPYVTLYVAKGSSKASDWTNMYAYLYGDGENASWPGVSILSNQASFYHGSGNRTYYYVKYYTEGNSGKNYTNVIFNNGDGAQTVDLTTTSHNGYFFDMSKESTGTAKLDGNWRKMESMYNVDLKRKLNTESSATAGLGSSSSGCGYIEVTPKTTYDMTDTDTAIVGSDATNNATIKATPNTGYEFVNWVVTGGASVASTTSRETTLTSTAAGTATAVFKKSDYTIDYPTPSNYTITNNTASAQMGVQASFTLTAASGYRIKNVTAKYTGTNTSVNLNKSSGDGTYTFTMPASNVTITITTQQTCVINYTTSGTGISSVSATQGGTAFSSGATVDTGKAIVITPSFQTGYELDTANSTTADWNASTGKYSFTSSANRTISIVAKKKDYQVTVKKQVVNASNAAAGTVSFYRGSNNASGTAALILDTSASTRTSTAQYQQDLSLKVVDANGYYLKSVKIGTTPKYTGTENGTHTIYLGKMPASEATITVIFEAIVPAITKTEVIPQAPYFTGQDNSSSFVYAGQNFVFKTSFTNVTKITKIEYDNNTIPSNTATSPDTIKRTVPKNNTFNRNGDTLKIKVYYRNRYIDDDNIFPETSEEYYINVKYTSVQLAYLQLEDLLNECSFASSLTAADCESGYDDFIRAYNAANDVHGSDLPNHNDTVDKYTSKKNALQTAYNNLVFKTNTVYVLSQYSSGVKVRFSSASKWIKAKNYNSSNFISQTTTPHYYYKMTAEGNTTTGPYYLYSITFPGKANVSFYYSTNDNAVYNDSNKLTNSIAANNIEYGEYYYDIKTASTGGTTSSTSVRSSFTDLGISATGNRSLVKPYDSTNSSETSYSGEDIKNKLRTTFKGSLVETSSCDVTESYVITGPYGRRYSESDRKTTSSMSSTDNTKTWQPNKNKPGRYEVTVTYSVGTDSRNDAGAKFNSTKKYDLYVAYDEIEVYIDMNENPGTPSFQYEYTLKDETRYLPFELELETGSEYIHSTKFKISELDKYKTVDLNNGITFSKVFVDTDEIGNGFTIESQAARTGQIWLKADSTHMTEFKVIGYEAASRHFVALDENNNVIAYMGDDDGTPYPRTYSTEAIPTPVMPIESVLGTGIITDDEDGAYEDFYAAYDTEDDSQRSLSYNVKAKATKEFKIKNANGTYGDTYYFDGWKKAEYNNGTYTPTGSWLTEEPTYSFNDAPDNDSANYYYVAKYVKVNSENKKQRLEITYKFKDYDNSDGVMEFNEAMTNGEYRHTTSATYTKTIKTDLSLSNLATAENVKNLAQSNFPIIQSSYFDYSFDSSATPTEIHTDTSNKKVTAEISITYTPRVYTLSVNTNVVTPDSSNKHFFQQTRKLDANDYGVSSNYAWYVGTGDSKTLVSTERYFNIRFTGNMVVTVESDSNANLTSAKSNIQYTYSTKYRDGTSDATERVSHNFYIIDRPANGGTFVGAGVLYATTDLVNGEQTYRQSSAENNLSNANRNDFIERILSPTNYAVEFKPQTIENTGFNYIPFSNHYDLFRYSDNLNAYQYFFAADSVNRYSEETKNQKLRVYSFLVYSTTSGSTTTYYVTSSDYYAEVTRYINASS